ncbi:fibronectin type III domain-containing protein, partial [bacterium]|nr:fibronectin type III domain-containing protein [bacterium]
MYLYKNMIEKIKQASLKLKSGLKNPKHKEKWQKIAGLLIISLFVAASVFVNQGAWAKFYRTTAPTTGFSYGYGYGFEAGYGYGYGYGSADYASDSSVADYGYLMSQRYPSSSVSGITRTGATVTITTTYKALAKVKYGTTSGSLTNETSYSSSYSTSTSVALSSLSCGTTYYYKAVVKDIGGNEWEETSEQSFETLACVSGGGGGGDYSAPVISNIEVTVSSSTATIAWETNEPSISWIVYGTSTDYGLEVKTTSYVTSHSVTLTDLTPETTYHYQ